MAKTKNAGGLSMKHKIGYAFGDMGGCMTFALMGSIVTRYYTNVLQVNTVVLATMLLVWNVWDAVNDPLMGALMDKVFAKPFIGALSGHADGVWCTCTNPKSLVRLDNTLHG